MSAATGAAGAWLDRRPDGADRDRDRRLRRGDSVAGADGLGPDREHSRPHSRAAPARRLPQRSRRRRPATTAPLPTGAPGFSLTLQPFATIDGAPLAIAAPDDGTGRLFVVSQDGRIWVVKADGTTLPDPLVDLRSLVKSGGEQGLLGLALHPGFPTDPRFYVDFTNADGDTVVAEPDHRPERPESGRPSDLQAGAVPESSRTRTTTAARSPSGRTATCTSSFGDGGSGGDPQGNGQNTEVLLGKILRLDVDGAVGGAPLRDPAGQPIRRLAAARRRSGCTACATRGGCRSIGRPATCGSATSARTRTRRSTSLERVSAGSTSAGTGWRPATATDAGSARRTD